MKNIKLPFLILWTILFSTSACFGDPYIPPPPTVIYSLAVYENRIYASVSGYYDQYLVSLDDGKKWDMKSKEFLKETFSLPYQVIEELKQYPELPVTVCLPDSLNTCYRTDQEEIIQSVDKGKTWSVSWSIPLEQRKVLENSSPLMDLRPYDLALFNYNDKNILVAAMGTGGILVKTDDGAWENIGVWGVGPIPLYEATDNTTATP